MSGLKSSLEMIKSSRSINGLNLIFTRVSGSGAGVKKKNWLLKSSKKLEKILSASFLRGSIRVFSLLFAEKMLSHLNFMRNEPLYALLKTLPKGTLHHDHFDCNEDPEFVSHVLFLV